MASGDLESAHAAEADATRCDAGITVQFWTCNRGSGERRTQEGQRTHAWMIQELKENGNSDTLHSDKQSSRDACELPHARHHSERKRNHGVGESEGGWSRRPHAGRRRPHAGRRRTHAGGEGRTQGGHGRTQGGGARTHGGTSGKDPIRACVPKRRSERSHAGRDRAARRESEDARREGAAASRDAGKHMHRNVSTEARLPSRAAEREHEETPHTGSGRGHAGREQTHAVSKHRSGKRRPGR